MVVTADEFFKSIAMSETILIFTMVKADFLQNCKKIYTTSYWLQIYFSY